MIEKTEKIGGQEKTTKKLTNLSPALSTPFENSYWVIADQFMAGQIPTSSNTAQSHSKLDQLISFQVQTVINLMEPQERNSDGVLFYPYAPYLQQRGIDTYSFPVVDLSIPSRELMTSILRVIDEEMDKGKRIYLHCWGGIGRTGTVVGCYLKQKGLATNQNVFEQIAILKQYSGLAHRLSPETDEQRQFVLQWD